MKKLLLLAMLTGCGHSGGDNQSKTSEANTSKEGWTDQIFFNSWDACTKKIVDDLGIDYGKARHFCVYWITKASYVYTYKDFINTDDDKIVNEFFPEAANAAGLKWENDTLTEK